MATVAVSGSGGSISGNGINGATEIKDWAITLNIDVLDATSMASTGWREFIFGLKGGTGRFTCIGVRPDPLTTAAAATATFTQSTGGGTISGTILLGSVEVSPSVDSVVTYVATFSFSGAITLG